MKIVIVNNYFSPLGGAEIISYNMFNFLKTHGHEVFFWSTNKKPFFENNSSTIKYFTNLNEGMISYLKNPIKYYYNYQAQKDLKIFLDEVKPDLIILHNIFLLTFSILKVCQDIPTIMILHDCNLICPSSKLLLENKNICKEQLCRNGNFLPCIKNKCCKGILESSIRHALLSYINIKNLKNIDKFITPSNVLRQLVLNANIGIKKNDIVTINNFLSNNEIKDIQPNYQNRKYFLYIGRLSKEKGIHYLLEAIKVLPKVINLHIVGTGTEEKKLKQYARDNNLDNVKFLGFKNREEIKEEYQKCIATVLPTDCFDNFPTTNLESFINGKPIIASKIGGIPEQVEHNITGLLFEPTNVEQLKECILKYWNNPELAIEHGKNGYQKAITQYTEDKYYNELMKVYEEVLNESKK